MLWSSNQTSPFDDASSRRITRPIVVFPDPDSPTSPSVSPCAIAKSTPSTAFTSPTWRENSPACIGKYLYRSLTSSSVFDAVALALDIGCRLHRDGALIGGALVVQPAARDVALAEIVHRNRLLADRHAIAAARRERASGRQTQQVGRLPGYRLQAPAFARIQARQRREQTLRIRHLRIVEDLLGGAVFDHVAAVHYQHVLADFGDDSQV